MCSISKTFDEATKCFCEGRPEKMALLSGAEYNAETKQIKLRYLNHDFFITFPDGKITPASADYQLTIEEKALILLYLGQATGEQLTNKWISYAELPGGMLHDKPFKAAAVQPLADYFNTAKPEELLQITQPMGGTELGIGDIGVKIPVFPHVVVGIFLWMGDDEFPTKVNLVFDAVAPKYLTTAQLYVTGIVISNRILENKG